MEKLKIYDVFIDEAEAGVYAMSYVNLPAIEEKFKYFKDMKLQKIDEEKRMVYGPAMIADKLIFRRNDATGEEFYVRFPAETVRKMAHKFLMDNNHHNMTVDHEGKAKDSVVVESWVKESSNDKSIGLGFEDLPNPTWFVGSRVDNDQVWNRVKSGELLGYSIEIDAPIVEATMRQMFAEIETVIQSHINQK